MDRFRYSLSDHLLFSTEKATNKDDQVIASRYLFYINNRKLLENLLKIYDQFVPKTVNILNDIKIRVNVEKFLAQEINQIFEAIAD